MKFGNFLFPDCRDPERDGVVIDETLREAWLSDELGMDAIWLGEHHFDGICAYVDPIAFAGALATTVRRAAVGFAVIQTSLHHPIRLAEQLAILDNILKGRLLVGLGRGTAYNIYDYQGYGIEHREAQERLEEAEGIMRRAWTGEAFEHHGRYWDLKVPALRPLPYTRPHPVVIRGASGEASLVELARHGRPFLMNVQSLETTRHRVDLYCRTMAEAGHDEARIAANLGASWVWRNVFVAESDAEAERVGVPLFKAMTESRMALRNRIYAETGMRIEVPESQLPQSRATVDHGLLRGAPATVAEHLAAIAETGVGGVIMTFRLGPMPHEVASASLSLFMGEVAPQLRSTAAAPGC